MPILAPIRRATGPRRSGAGLLAAVALVACACACGGSATHRDASRLQHTCGVVSGHAVDETQARCIAKIYGVKQTSRCPMEVDQVDHHGAPVFRVREACTGLGVMVETATGRVVAVVAEDDVILD